MQRLLTLLLSGLVWASLAATAQSQEGSSLYEPFAEPSSIARAERFVDDLDLEGAVSRKQLEAGVVVNRRNGDLTVAEVPAGAASDRAAGGDGLDPSFGWLLGAALLVLGGLAAMRLPRVASRAA
jgi:hypothetical protein